MAMRDRSFPRNVERGLLTKKQLRILEHLLFIHAPQPAQPAGAARRATGAHTGRRGDGG